MDSYIYRGFELTPPIFDIGGVGGIPVMNKRSIGRSCGQINDEWVPGSRSSKSSRIGDKMTGRMEERGKVKVEEEGLKSYEGKCGVGCIVRQSG